MVKICIARRSNGPWSSPVLKKTRDWRPCGDYGPLNDRTKLDRYPVCWFDDFTTTLHGKKEFTIIDLVKAFNQIPVAEKDIKNTAIITLLKFFEFPVMTFGLHNSAQTFQRFIGEVTRDLPFVFPYIDDVFIASYKEEEHTEHLKIRFNRLQEHGLIINVTKSVFGKP